MAYEKKIEPLQRWEVFMTGFTLQWFIVFFLILPWTGISEKCLETVWDTDITSLDSLTSFHDCIDTHRSGILAGVSCLLLGYPIIIGHIYFHHRINETISSFLNFGLVRWLYNASWALAGTIYCTIVPAIGIFIAYYDWEFGNGDGSDNDNYQIYFGYSMQFKFTQLFFIVWDCTIIPLGVAAAIPWLNGILILYKCCPSSHWQISDSAREKLVGGQILRMPCGKVCLTILLLTIVLICLFGAFGDVFDFDNNGFWSYNGGSQFLGIILFVAWELESIVFMLYAWRLDTNMQFLNENVQSMAQQDNLQMTQTANGGMPR